jgi:addiction module HigA family antidote
MARLKPIHPGEILREEFMAPLHLNANKLALALDVSAPSIYDIVKEERGISPEMALRLEMPSERLPIFGSIFNRTLICESCGMERKPRSRVRFVRIGS